MAGSASRFWAVGALLLGALFPLQLWAQVPGLPGSWTTQSGVALNLGSPNRVIASPGPASLLTQLLNNPRAVTAGGTQGSALLLDLLKGPGPVSPADVRATRNLPWAKLGTSIIRGLPLLGTAIAVAEILEAVRCREGFNAGPECDLGTDEVTEQGDCYKASGASVQGTCAASPSAAQLVLVGLLNNLPNGGGTANCPKMWWNGTAPASVVLGQSASGTIHSQAAVPYQAPGYCGQNVSNVTTSVSRTQSAQTACPAIVVNGVTLVPVKGLDDKCPTNIYVPVAETVAADRIEQYGPKPLGLPSWQEIIEAGAEAPHDPPVIEVTSPPQVRRETTTEPDGTTTVRDTDYPWVEYPDGYGWAPRVTTRTYPPNSTIPPPGEISDGTVTTGTGSGTIPEIITCGLPNTPACKIDEGGMPPPPPPTVFDPVEDPIDPLRALITDPEIPEVAFTWSFQLPTGCSVMNIGPFAGQMVAVDICAYQPMIHDIMSVIWGITGILGGMSIFRNAFQG